MAAASGILANKPFDDPEADVIFLTNDNISFRVFKRILSCASPFFRTMFSLPQPSTQDMLHSSSPSVVPVPDLDGATLDRLLRICYPIPKPMFNIDGADRLLEAGRKYDIELVMVYCKEELRRMVDTDPLRVYSFACLQDLEDEARMAAKAALRLDFDDIFKQAALFDLIAGHAAQALGHLLQYYRQCSRLIPRVLNMMRQLDVSQEFFWCKTCMGCMEAVVERTNEDLDNPYTDPPILFAHAWWFTYMDDIKSRAPSIPVASVVDLVGTMIDVFKAKGPFECPMCRDEASTDIPKFVAEFQSDIETELSKIELQFDHHPPSLALRSQ
ncbi:hypothetical protein BXZ70DRAFT_919426 [Cristinia sonorae]|uniref:BTB domain-containing protein n=1 Tax=Cristinia sonorae TaxID=1940300 RepID=A0A8K0UX80_9AGAR|nr:hypothetical protein BXZ70DRAFT_919426 [Cristinia sonorae]